MRPTRDRRRLAACLVAAIALGAPAAAAGRAPARVPQGFVGVVADGVDTPSLLNSEPTLMVASGVESVRLPFHWAQAQPYPSFTAVPRRARGRYRDVLGVPTDFRSFDAMVTAYADRGVSVLPVLTTPPGWAQRHPGDHASPPLGTAAFSAYALALAWRYGPGGSFWRDNPAVPRRPIRRWQIWNEPGVRTGWSDPDWAPGYVALLRAARASIRRADRRAQIVLGGMVRNSPYDLRAIYRQPGARRSFDTVAIHPYSRRPTDIVTIARRVRRVMKRYGDARKPLAITEFGWPSSLGKTPQLGFETTEPGQAFLTGRALRRLGRHRRELRLTSVYLHSWVTGDEPSGASFDYSGLRTLTPGGVFSKPALRAFASAALGLERCRRKSVGAGYCAEKLR